jgi:hypothetical protein
MSTPMGQLGGGGGNLRVWRPPQIMGPLVAENLTPSDYSLLQSSGANLKKMFRDCIYDRQRYVSGTAVPTTQIVVFSTPVGQQKTVINSPATTYSATLIDTNVSQANQLPKGDIFVITSIQVKLEFVGAIDTTITSGEALVPTPTGTPPSVTNNMRCALYGGYIQLKLGPINYELGPLWQYPAGPYTLSGMAGAGISTTSSESFIQNGFGRPRECKPWHVIDPGRSFMILLQWIDAWTPQSLFYLTFILDGFRLTDVG